MNNSEHVFLLRYEEEIMGLGKYPINDKIISFLKPILLQCSDPMIGSEDRNVIFHILLRTVNSVMNVGSIP